MVTVERQSKENIQQKHRSKMTCKEIGVKEKSISLNRLFSSNQNKKKKVKRNKKKETKVSNCQILENKKTIDEGEGSINKYSDEENNNQLKEKQSSLASTLRTEVTCSAVNTDKNIIEVNTRTCSTRASLVSIASSIDNKVKTEQLDDDHKVIFSMIFEAIQYKEVTMLHRIIQAHPYLDINELNEDGIAVIHFAAMVGSATTITPLLKYGADIDLKDIRGNPPLHYAYNMRKFEFVSTALELGANINLLNKKDISKLEKILGKSWGES